MNIAFRPPPFCSNFLIPAARGLCNPHKDDRAVTTGIRHCIHVEGRLPIVQGPYGSGCIYQGTGLPHHRGKARWCAWSIQRVAVVQQHLAASRRNREIVTGSSAFTECGRDQLVADDSHARQCAGGLRKFTRGDRGVAGPDQARRWRAIAQYRRCIGEPCA
jgi:hypothetical protein